LLFVLNVGNCRILSNDVYLAESRSIPNGTVARRRYLGKWTPITGFVDGAAAAGFKI
jgi:hypothetical protein